WGRALQAQGDYAGAERHVEEGLALASRIGDLRLESTTTGQLGILAFQVGRYGAARSYYQRALELARSIGDRLIESGMLNNLGETERTLGNYEASFDVFQAGRRICAEIGQRLADAYMLCNIAHVTLPRVGGALSRDRPHDDAVRAARRACPRRARAGRRRRGARDGRRDRRPLRRRRLGRRHRGSALDPPDVPRRACPRRRAARARVPRARPRAPAATQRSARCRRARRVPRQRADAPANRRRLARRGPCGRRLNDQRRAGVSPIAAVPRAGRGARIPVVSAVPRTMTAHPATIGRLRRSPRKTPPQRIANGGIRNVTATAFVGPALAMRRK